MMWAVEIGEFRPRILQPATYMRLVGAVCDPLFEAFDLVSERLASGVACGLVVWEHLRDGTWRV